MKEVKCPRVREVDHQGYIRKEISGGGAMYVDPIRDEYGAFEDEDSPDELSSSMTQTDVSSVATSASPVATAAAAVTAAAALEEEQTEEDDEDEEVDSSPNYQKNALEVIYLV